MAKRWHWSRNKVRNFLKWLEKEQQIVQQKVHKLTTIITICNYERYQNDTTEGTTEGQQKDNRRYTNKNDKNDKNDNNKKKRIYGSIKDLGEKEFDKVAEKYSVPLPFVRSVYDDMVNYCESKGKSYKNYLATLRNWVKKEALKVKQGQRGKQNITYVGDTT